MTRLLFRRACTPVLLAVVVLGALGCDVVEKQDETRQYVGRYAAEAPPDTLLLSFFPGSNYDEEDESPYLPDTTFDLLQMGGHLQLELNDNGRSANQGGVRGELFIPDSIYLDRDSLYYLAPDTSVVFDGTYVAVVDRLFMREASDLQPTDTTATGEEVTWTLPLPEEWFGTSDGGLTGTAAGVGVEGLVYFFNWSTGRQDSMVTTVGNMVLQARLSRE